MALWDWFIGLFNKDYGTLELDAYVGELTSEIFYKELAVQACVNLIANAVSRSEFQTFEKGKQIKGENYYLFNVEPNQNKSSSKFWRDVIHKLVYDNECLVIQQNGEFYVADSYNVKKFAFKEYLYFDIEVDDYKLSNTYSESEVFHFELHDQKIKNVIEGLYKDYSKLLAASQTHYKKNITNKGTLEVPGDYPQTDQAQENLKVLLEKRFKRFFDAEGDAVLPLTDGLKYNDIKENSKEKGSQEGRDIRHFIDDIFDFVAIGFQMSPKLLKGEVSDTGKAVNDLLTFCVNPLAELISDEINRKQYGKKNYLERTYLKIDTSRIKSVDITDIASSLDILLRIGAYSIDDCLKILGLEPLETEWSKKRWMTKNYESITDSKKDGD